MHRSCRNTSQATPCNPWHRFWAGLHHVVKGPEPLAYQHAHRTWMLNRLFESVDTGTCRTAVEIGCGDGINCDTMALRFDRVVGFDINVNRLRHSTRNNVLLVAGDAERLPIGSHTADLVISVALMEHMPDRIAAFRAFATLVKPGGQCIHIAPVAPWKIFQWVLFPLATIRQHLASLLRAMAGQRRVKQPEQNFAPRTGDVIHGETNNPRRTRKKVWYRKIVPRVHGEYDSNWDEFRQWRCTAWRQQAEAAGLRVVQQVKLGCASPYGFGLSRVLGRLQWLGLHTVVAFVVAPAEDVPADDAEA